MNTCMYVIYGYMYMYVAYAYFNILLIFVRNTALIAKAKADSTNITIAI